MRPPLASPLRAAAARIGAMLARAGDALRLVLGAPDYERYLGDALRRHPESQPLSRDEFVAARLRARYDRPGSRCC